MAAESEFELPPLGTDVLFASVRDLGFTTHAQTDSVVRAIVPDVIEYATAARAPLIEANASLSAANAALSADKSALLSRIAELESLAAKLTTKLAVKQGIANTLRAELERCRADAQLEWEPGRAYALAELLRRAVGALKMDRGSGMLWPSAMKTFGVGSTVACAICRWAGRDPDTGKDSAEQAKGGSENEP